MAYKATDGSLHTNASSMRKANMKSESMASKAAPAEDMEQDNESEPQEPQEPSEVVAEHGPAEMVTVSHKDGKHKVTSTHKGGHKHTSEHESASDAHDAAKTLSGVAPAQDDESDDADAAPANGPMQAMMGQ
jgi:hypothetical protein